MAPDPSVVTAVLDLLLLEDHVQFEGRLVRSTAGGFQRDLHVLTALSTDGHSSASGICSVVASVSEDDDVLAFGEPGSAVGLDDRDSSQQRRGGTGRKGTPDRGAGDHGSLISPFVR